jgi:hypothetical protein
MTRFTKMSITPAKPLSHTTTKFAFKFYKIFAMLWTILNWNLATIRTNKLFSFK